MIFSRESSANYSISLSHPRLLLLENEGPALREFLDTDSSIRNIHNYILSESNMILDQPLLKYKLTGLRLLVGREALRRIFYLSYTYRITGDVVFAERAIREIVNVCEFSDWNPRHFLDVGEMTMGVAIGYDWLYQNIDEPTRMFITKKIQELSFEPSFRCPYSSFSTKTNNWNPVCQAGLLFGAIAFRDELPTLSEKIIERCIKTTPISMKAYEPDGVYPEGYSYWSYGTTSQVLINDALENVFGTDFGLNGKEGFMESIYFIQYMATPLEGCFNFSDSPNRININIASWWFAAKLRDTSLLYLEKKQLSKDWISQVGELRLLPALPIFASRLGNYDVKSIGRKCWIGKGINPVYIYRSGWEEKEDVYLGVKGGSASTSHAHMDAGSFIYEYDGVRWAMDLGMQDYNSLESKGVGVWKNGQEGQRWDILRMRNEYHNTLSIDNARHNVTARADFTDTFTSNVYKGAIIDLTTTLGKVKYCTREVALDKNDHLIVNDNIETGDSTVKVMWVMVTPAKARICEDGSIVLSKDGKRMTLSFKTSGKLTPQIWSTSPLHDYDKPNEGTLRVGYEMVIPRKKKIRIETRLKPQ